MNRLFLLILMTLTVGCTGIPTGVTAVNDFEVTRYLGTWYEIARLDHSFEHGLNNISATYTLRQDGGIDVLNKGWNIAEREWETAEGVGYFIDQPSVARLKVSFFRPFYGAYNIINLDKTNYSYSVITGPDKSYLWILSRTRQLPEQTLNKLINQLKAQGYATEKLIFDTHDK